MPGTFQVAVEALIVKDGKVLISKRADDREHGAGEWETITGRVEQGETLEEAVIREVEEETTLKVEVIKVIDTFHFYRGKEKVEHQGVSFWCKYLSGEVKLDPYESSECRWVTEAEAMEIVTDESTRKSIKELFRLLGARS